MTKKDYILISIMLAILAIITLRVFGVSDGAGTFKLNGDDLDVDEPGKIYMYPIDTPELGVHTDHTAFYPKADTYLYYLYDDAGQIERKLLYEDANGTNIPVPTWETFTPTVTIVGGAGNTVPEYITNNGRYVQVGKIVYVDVLLSGDGGDEGAGTGQIHIALPVTSGTNISNGIPFPCGSLSTTGYQYTLSAELSDSSDTVALMMSYTFSLLYDVIGDYQDNTVRAIRLHFWYEID